MHQHTARVVRFTGLLSAALSTGVFFGTRASLSPSSKHFPPCDLRRGAAGDHPQPPPGHGHPLAGERRGEPGGVGPLASSCRSAPG
jgi:hypothetical protein